MTNNAMKLVVTDGPPKAGIHPVAKGLQVPQANPFVSCYSKKAMVDSLNLRMVVDRENQPFVTKESIGLVHKVCAEMPKLSSDSMVSATKFLFEVGEEDDSDYESEDEGENGEFVVGTKEEESDESEEEDSDGHNRTTTNEATGVGPIIAASDNGSSAHQMLNKWPEKESISIGAANLPKLVSRTIDSARESYSDGLAIGGEARGSAPTFSHKVKVVNRKAVISHCATQQSIKPTTQPAVQPRGSVAAQLVPQLYCSALKFKLAAWHRCSALLLSSAIQHCYSAMSLSLATQFCYSSLAAQPSRRRLG
ncbi:hypothetical protein U1Q18_037754 [Sarracenia purpurea var. burkii]